MPTSNADWAQRFLRALAEKPERKEAHQRLLDAGAKRELLQRILQDMFSTHFAEEKQAKLRAAVSNGRELQRRGLHSATSQQINRVEQSFRAALGAEADILFDCA